MIIDYCCVILIYYAHIVPYYSWTVDLMINFQNINFTVIISIVVLFGDFDLGTWNGIPK